MLHDFLICVIPNRVHSYSSIYFIFIMNARKREGQSPDGKQSTPPKGATTFSCLVCKCLQIQGPELLHVYDECRYIMYTTYIYKVKRNWVYIKTIFKLVANNNCFMKIIVLVVQTNPWNPQIQYLIHNHISHQAWHLWTLNRCHNEVGTLNRNNTSNYAVHSERENLN